MEFLRNHIKTILLSIQVVLRDLEVKERSEENLEEEDTKKDF
ncbi:15792_t:CDS:2 [Funneliformis mosseae]|uniref:15792_t:CDS:1 n=1 Tax=Funneliformis mosseae TaxID=27381 RepID=A0A9N9GKG0_FUNMO|nr:15792_t:CDS:2 [Funneliformis mosseae]